MATAMSFVVSFFLTPFITNMLGTEAYGFVTLSKNFVSYAVIISTALDSYATRYIAMEYHTICSYSCNNPRICNRGPGTSVILYLHINSKK